MKRQMVGTALAATLVAVAPVPAPTAARAVSDVALATPITSATIDGTDFDPVVHNFWGIGSLTQGGQQRLIYDYPEPQRTRMLDFLFCSPMVTPTSGFCTSPGAGAAFHTLKVEIGGDGFEAEGAEPSYAHTQAEFNAAPATCHYRGYSWWFMQQAKLRNPNIKFHALAWGVPGWVGGVGGARQTIYTQQGADYVVRFLQCAKKANLEVDRVGVLNEDSDPAHTAAERNFIVNNLKPTITAATNPTLSTKIVCCDFGYDPWRTLMDIPARGGADDVALRNAVDFLGVHYPRGPADVDTQAFSVQFNKPVWVTEESVSGDLAFGNPPRTTRLIGELHGALMLANQLVFDWMVHGITHADVLFYLNGFYDILYAPGAGFMTADQPWTGQFNVQPGLWTIAHINQFSQPGWHFLNGQAYGCFDPALCRGRYMTLSDGSNYSIFAGTGDAPQAYPVTFTITGGLSTGQVHVWKTNASGNFVQQPDPTMNGNTFQVTFEPNSIYTISTLSGRSKLATGPVPTQAHFPASYVDDFDSYQIGDSDPASSARNIPRYLSTMEGSFDLATAATCGGGSQCLAQLAPVESKRQFGTPGEEPYAILGHNGWRNYETQARIAFPAGAAATDFGSVQGRIEPVMNEGLDFNRHGGYEFQVQRNGGWKLYRHHVSPEVVYTKTLLQSGAVGDLGTSWHTIKIRFEGLTIRGYIDNLSTPVVTYQDTAANSLATGMAGIGSGWNIVGFDDLTVTYIGDTEHVVDDRVTGSGTRQVDYHGTWTPCAPCGPQDLDYLDTITSSSTSGDFLLFRFTGRRVILYGTKAQNGGRAMVSALDSSCTTVLVPEVQVDFFREARAVGQQVMYASPPGPSGSYCLKVRVLGTGQPGQTDIGGGLNNIHIDAIAVVP